MTRKEMSLLKKLFLLFLFSISTLYGCTQESEKIKEQTISSKDVNEETSTTTKHENFRILEIENENIVIGPPATDPEASYPAYEVFIEEDTKVEGEKTTTNELREGDHVTVWTKTEGSKKEVAEKIVVLK